jgi:hypothetical protein
MRQIEYLRRIILSINNHADCIQIKVPILWKDRANDKNGSFKDKVEQIDPIKFDIDEFNRNFQQIPQ